jgi:hypothetical protein
MNNSFHATGAAGLTTVLAPSEIWDDDFEFQKSTAKANNLRMSFASSDWDHDDLANNSSMKILGDKKNTISYTSGSVDVVQ